MTAATQMNRIVQMIAEASRLGDGAEIPIADLARQLGVSSTQIQEDIRVLTLLGERASDEWLLSLEVWQEGDAVHITSRGPWRRPLRLTPDELIALRIALATDPEASSLITRLGMALDQLPEPAGIGSPRVAATILDTVRSAVDTCRRLEVLYAGEGTRAAKARVIQPHQLFGYKGYWYCVAWCESAEGWRHFRVDRMVDAQLAKGFFEPREDAEVIYQSTQVFQADAEALEDVRVRFTPGVARWVKESYPRHETVKGGGVDVVFRAGSPQWLARHVLQYGAEAEVMEPKAYREAVRRVVGLYI